MIKYKIHLLSIVMLSLFSCDNILAKKTTEIKVDSTITINKIDSMKIYKRKYNPVTKLEMYDFEAGNNSKKNPTLYITNDGCKLIIHPMFTSGGAYEEYPAQHRYQKILKQFYPNGDLKQKSIFFQTNLKIGVWKYYDESGKLIKSVNEDEKFEGLKVQLEDVINLLEKEGWINLETGEGDTVIIEENNSIIIKPRFNVMLTKDEDSRNIWYVSILKSPVLNITYRIDCETGNVKKEEVIIFGYE